MFCKITTKNIRKNKIEMSLIVGCIKFQIIDLNKYKKHEKARFIYLSLAFSIEIKNLLFKLIS